MTTRWQYALIMEAYCRRFKARKLLIVMVSAQPTGAGSRAGREAGSPRGRLKVLLDESVDDGTPASIAAGNPEHEWFA
jgi:hypothetical protein